MIKGHMHHFDAEAGASPFRKKANHDQHLTTMSTLRILVPYELALSNKGSPISNA
jgi:hypothetical protein